MDKQDWYDQRDDRTLRYGARRLDHARWIALSATPDYLRRYDAQVAAIVAANILSRMTPSVAISFPDVELHPALPWRGSLHEFLLAQMHAADPYGAFIVRNQTPSDFCFHLGPGIAANGAHGTGWNAFIGPGPSPLPASDDLNCVGASLAVILGAAQLFINGFDATFARYICNGLNWRAEPVSGPAYEPGLSLGNILVAGVGSVGTAALYFLSLATRDFRPALIDMDKVEIHNLDRSPIFLASDLRQLKVDSTRDYLRGVGVKDIRIDDKPLHESVLWNERQVGETDLVIAAANEHKARYYIEAGYPPIQLYGTTGRNWQAAVMRHDPFGDACSLCLFPTDQEAAPTDCATVSDVAPARESGPRIDAALPFLSFAAGLMTAAEALKLRLPGYPFSADRVVLNTRPSPFLVHAPMQHRSGCFCERRNREVHHLMIAGTRYAGKDRGRDRASQFVPSKKQAS